MLRQLLEKFYSVEELVPITERPGVSVFRATLDGRRMALKVHARKSAFIRELDALSLAEKVKIAVPSLVDSISENEYHIIVQSWVSGVPASEHFSQLENRSRLAIVGSASRELAKLQTGISRDDLMHHSFWKQENDPTSFERFSWNEHLTSQIEKWAGRIRDVCLAGFKDCLVNFVKNIPEPTELKFIHRDFVLRNFLCDGAGFVAMIDFEAASIGDPLWDLAKMNLLELNSDPSLKRHWLTTWERTSGRVADIRRIEIYEAIEAFAFVAWVDKQPKDYVTVGMKTQQDSCARFLRQFLGRG